MKSMQACNMLKQLTFRTYGNSSQPEFQADGIKRFAEPFTFGDFGRI
jgi:hypothetical protein